MLPLLSTLFLAFSSALAATVSYELVLSPGYTAPDGVLRKTYLVNGQSPGPHLTAKQGDDLEINVLNFLDVAVTIHFHGIEQTGTSWSDGVPGVTQRLIESGQSFLYKWKATQSGLYWYHAHCRELYEDGIRGTLYLEPDPSLPTPFDLISSEPDDLAAMIKANADPKIISLSEWKHLESEQVLQEWDRTHVEPLCADSFLINGRGQVHCPLQNVLDSYISPSIPALTPKGCIDPHATALGYPDARPNAVNPDFFYNCQNTTSPISVISVDPETNWASLAIANIGSWSFIVSIDSHKLYVYSADGQYHHPQAVDVLPVAIGHRYQVMIKLDQPTADYTIHVGSDVPLIASSGYAVLSYTQPDDGITTFTPPPVNPMQSYGGRIASGATVLNSLSLKPFPATLVPPEESNRTYVFHLGHKNSTAWYLNNTPMDPFLLLEEPLLFAPQSMAQLDSSLRFSHPTGTVVDLVFQSGPGNPPHPIHKHRVSAWIIGAGPGYFKWNSVTEAMEERPEWFNLVDPPLRDGFMTLGGSSFLVVRYVVNDPGVTFIHCHINNHHVSGMAAVLMEGIEDMPAIPRDYMAWNSNAGQMRY
ncbi:hypothetical protein BOTBODRAFT_143361 [Botryobasidium botryosum FD-172 SS1]|uniref:Multicopper oxidase n=1 Tax=Botryobasidium botryosum (strain FD-172 SS1) TaxID=930990 RepID=A0A067MRE4_BOTB1|nr:hypothetical protein BOTBODRAFT_143361 [Botryobasidium botryosum FD-172 SS1]